MGPVRVKNFTRILALLIAVAAVTPGTANALGHRHQVWQTSDDWTGYAVPIQDVYQFPASIVWQPTSSYGYTIPIQSAYQFPASLVNQPGVVPPLAPPRPLYISSGDHHVINR
jgi:hypothetical protein